MSIRNVEEGPLMGESVPSSVLAPFCQLEPHVFEHEYLGEENDYTAETEEERSRHSGRHASTDPPLNYVNLRVNQLLCC